MTHQHLPPQATHQNEILLKLAWQQKTVAAHVFVHKYCCLLFFGGVFLSFTDEHNQQLAASFCLFVFSACEFFAINLKNTELFFH